MEIENYSAQLSVILSSAIAIISVVANVIMALINSRTTLKSLKIEVKAKEKEKAMELSFEKKSTAFHHFFKAASDFMRYPESQEVYDDFSEAYCQALMYCSDDAMQALRYFYESVSTIRKSDDKSSSELLSNGIVSCAYELRNCILPDPSLYRENKSGDSKSEHH